jgi:long-chain acyl-CoA synthetase
MIGSMHTTLTGYLDDFLSRGNETAFAHRRGLRLVRWSYGRVARTAFQFARELEARSIAAGDRVLLWAENSPEWVAAFLGCVARGAIVVPLDVQSEPDFVSRVERQVEAKLALTDSGARARGGPSVAGIDLDEMPALVSRHSAERIPATATRPDDTFEIVFTSGTTAEPKGVRITHWNLLVNLNPLENEIDRYVKWERLVHPLRFLSLVPLSHVFGQIMGVFVPHMLGGEVFFQASLNPRHVVETIKRERISVLVAVPRMLEVLREKIERDLEARGRLERFQATFAAARGRHPLRRWWTFRAIHSMFGLKFWAFISGGATLARETEEFWDRLGFAVIQGYGMTETASLISVNHPFKLARGSIGKVMAGQEVKLAADGEILVRGENVTPGYWKGVGEAETADGGWFRTGDVGELDTDGNLYFKGRKKEVIVTDAGMKIYPEDIEQVLDRQPEVKASAVVGAVGPTGPEPLAVLILRRGDADARAIIERANRMLAQHQRVRRWFVWPGEDFPRTPTQKVRKGIVTAEALAALAGASRPEPVPVSAERAGTVGEIIARISGEAPRNMAPSATLGSDLKLDSLGRVELLSALEDRYQVEIDEATLTEATTLAEVERIVREGAQEEATPYPYPRWQQRWPLSWLRIALLNLLAMPATWILARPAVTGREYLRDVRGPVVFICNHVTFVDPALILRALPMKFRGTLSMAMDGEILRGFLHPPGRTGPLRRLLRLLEYVSVVFFFNVFSMPRKSGFRRSFEFAGEQMDRGYSILVFPEGRLTQDGEMGPFMSGTGLLISELHSPVVPMRLYGLWELKRGRRHSARPGDISVIFGEPVRYAPHESSARIGADLEERVKRL